MIMLIAAPAMAQSKGRHRDEQKTAAQENPAKKKAEEEAYQRALKSIPEPKGKIDPWQNAR
jgi:hypothetical protein